MAVCLGQQHIAAFCFVLLCMYASCIYIPQTPAELKDNKHGLLIASIVGYEGEAL